MFIYFLISYDMEISAVFLITVSNTLQCQTNYCVKHITVSKTLLCQAKTRTMFIYNVLLLTCRRHTSSEEDSKLSSIQQSLLGNTILSFLLCANFWAENQPYWTFSFTCFPSFIKVNV